MNFDFDRIRAHGWVVHCKRLAAGETFTVNVPQAYAPAAGQNISLWTRGRVTGIDRNTGLATAEKVPGASSLLRSQIPAADCLFTAQEPSEFWCINFRANRHRMPRVSVFSIAAGADFALDEGALVLFCAGRFRLRGDELEAPLTAQISPTFEARALEDVHGFIFKEKA